MFDKERDLVELGSHSYNLREGGTGMDLAMAKSNRLKTNIVLKEKYGDEWQSVRGKIGGNVCKEKKLGIFSEGKRFLGTNQMNTPNAIQKKKETFKKIKHSQGERNSQFGTMWITDGFKSERIQKDTLIPEGWKKGRVIKFKSNAR